MYDIFCISAGQLKSKKKNSVFSRKHRYLNYGLLFIASILGKSSYNPIVIHGLFQSPDFILNICEKYRIQNTKKPILLSIPSFFALDWAQQFSGLIKNRYPEKKIIVGGRWVVGNNTELIKSYMGVDLVVPGLVGKNILNIVETSAHQQAKHETVSNILKDSETIEYNHLHERDLFQPSIIVSTGCGMGCSFCEEKNIKLSKLKSAKVVADEMCSLITSPILVEASPYLESSMFVATEKWAKQLQKEREKRGVTCKWRVETRVDKLRPKIIPFLAKSGLKVLDLGLESASHKQLINMKKTKNPSQYLELAKKLINTAHDNGIWVKVNVLLYAGETMGSIQETVNWLSKLRKAIKGVSVGPVIVYGLQADTKEFVRELEDIGAAAIETDMLGVTNISPSEEIDYKKSIEISKSISQEFMTAKDYYDLKSFSYFSRDYTYRNFKQDIKMLCQDDLSFKI